MRDTERRKRRWLQFRLQTLLTAIVVLSLPLSWLGVRLNRARKQREAVEAVKQLGGTVFYDWQATPPPMGKTPRQARPYPEWMRQVIGDDFFDKVIIVSLAPPTAERPLPDASGLPAPGSASPEKHQCIDDGDLHALAGLRQLRWLFLSRTRVTDKGLKCLQKMTSLKVVLLDDTQVTDEGLEWLKSLKNLEYLSLHSTLVTDQGIAKLQKALPNCRID